MNIPIDGSATMYFTISQKRPRHSHRQIRAILLKFNLRCVFYHNAVCIVVYELVLNIEMYISTAVDPVLI